MVLVIRKGARPRDVCINPDCPSKQLNEEEQKEVNKFENAKVEKKCPKCAKGHLVLRKSVYGTFLGCSAYPKCKHTEPLVAEKANIVKGDTEVVVKVKSEVKSEAKPKARAKAKPKAKPKVRAKSKTKSKAKSKIKVPKTAKKKK